MDTEKISPTETLRDRQNVQAPQSLTSLTFSFPALVKELRFRFDGGDFGLRSKLTMRSLNVGVGRDAGILRLSTLTLVRRSCSSSVVWLLGWLDRDEGSR